MKVGDYVIVPTAIRGTGENIKGVVEEITPDILDSAHLVTVLYIEPPVNIYGENRCVCYDFQLDQINE